MTDFSAIPAGPHWAIIQSVSVYIPGDERSRTNPGHGYQERTETYIWYKAFLIKEDWEKEIKQLTTTREKFRAFKAEPAKISIKVDVDIT